MISDKNLKEVLTRGVKKIIKKESLEKKLASGKILRIKHGVDPTTADLHLGYAVIYRKLKQFQDLGHKIIFLIGDFTGRFGDPTEQAAGPRPMRDKKEVKELAKNYLKQAGKILDLKKLEVRHNSEWYDRMSAEELLRLMSRFTAARMMERDMFQERIKKGLDIGLHEPVYPALQGYDSVMLKSDLAVIGSDQEFNEFQGRKAQEKFGQEPQDLLIMPLLTGLDGQRKMSQSLGNYIGLVENPDSQYGKIMSLPDNLTEEYVILLTDLDYGEIKKLHPRDAKMRLAREILKNCHGEKAAAEAEKNFKKVFQKGGWPEKMPEVFIKFPVKLSKILLARKIILSNAEFRRLVKSQGIEVDQKIISDVNLIIDKPTAVRIGKFRFLKISSVK
ncbi:MAG: tyrosine--tRNA ligase [Candidatus Niyogibacteria bacterium]|nr:tyrosine--tRNA ligase [Candidatus Niyogibacteria bacterium]